MFRSLFTHSTHAGSGITGRTARRAATRAAGLAALTIALLGALSSAAMAQGVRDHRVPGSDTWTIQPISGTPAPTTGTPLRVYFTGLTCGKVSNDNTWPRPDRDEPYVVIFSADLRGSGNAKVFVSQEFSDVDTGSSRDDWLQFWSVSGYGSPINSSNDYIFLVALMECDNSKNRLAVRDKVSNVLHPKLASYKQAGMSRSAMVSNLKADMDLAIETSRGTYSDADDRVGGIQEVLFSAQDLEIARSGHARTNWLNFVGSGSRYTLKFQLQ